eukprot:57365-Hanusia_phi.AAC.2
MSPSSSPSFPLSLPPLPSSSPPPSSPILLLFLPPLPPSSSSLLFLFLPPSLPLSLSSSLPPFSTSRSVRSRRREHQRCRLRHRKVVLQAGAVPIYLGAPNWKEFFPFPSAVIDAAAFESPLVSSLPPPFSSSSLHYSLPPLSSPPSLLPSSL